MSDDDGVLAIGGDLSVDRLILAYKFGIFPWYSEGQPIVWWYPRPRYIILADELKVPKSMRPYFNQKRYQVSIDRAFEQVIDICQNINRPNQEGTWITDDMRRAYIDLYKRGYAHSVEVWDGDETLIGGFYGVSVGRFFSGESMFSLKPNASKFGLISFVQLIREQLGIKVIDCQQHSKHMELLGGMPIDEYEYFQLLRENLVYDDYNFSWSDLSLHL